ncbi:MAG TPA: VWA domain-containing protein, partial [Candidatus Angelobacter sp.]|nr:VWA domain-containing protein [Candidatus Angelobacter sp.]
MNSTKVRWFVCFGSLVVLLGMPDPARGQSAAPPQGTGAQNSSRQQATFRATTRLVVLDVVATNDKGQAITDLKASDLTVLENGEPQEVIGFSFHTPGQITRSAAQPNIITNVPQFRGQSCLNVILLDAINTDFSSNAYAQEMLVKYLESSPTIQPTAVYALEANLKLLHDFTSDTQALRDVVSHYKSLAPTHIPTVEAAASPFGRRGTFQPVRQGRDAAFYAMSFLAENLAAYPGRKNLIWVSEGFPLNLFPDALMGEGVMIIEDNSRMMEKIADDLMAAQVAVYPISAAGVSLNSQFPAHSAMAGLAQRTGGKTFFNRNDIDMGVRTSLDDGATYYTLEYYPNNKTWDEKFRHIQVKASRPGLKLQHRDGYYAISPNVKYGESMVTHQFSDALSLTAPAATAITFQAAVTMPSEKTQNKLVVNFGLDPHTLYFQRGPDDLQHASVSCVVWAYPAKGDPIRAEGQTNAALKPDVF